MIRKNKELYYMYFFFSNRRRHTRSIRDWSSDVCSSDLLQRRGALAGTEQRRQPSGILVASEIAKAGRQIGRRRQQYRSEEHTSELQSRFDLVCRLLLEKKNIFRSRL